jgi:ATP-binding cassette subfamily B protein
MGVNLFQQIVAYGHKWLILVAATSVATAVVTLALPAVLGAAIDTLVAGGDSSRLILLAAMLIAFAVLADLTGSYTTTAGTAGTTAWLRLRLLRHLLSLNPAGGTGFSQGDLVSRVSANAADAAQAGPSSLTALVGVLPPLGSVVLLTLIDPWIALAFLAGVGLVALVLRAFTRHTTAVAAGYQQAQGAIAARLTEALAGIRTIAAAATTDRETERILQPLSDLSERGRRMWKVLARSSAQAAVAGPVVLVAVLAVGGFAVAAGRITAGELFAASRYAILGAGLGGLTGVLGVLSRSRAATQRVTEVLAAPAMTYGARALPSRVDGQLEFRGVYNVDLIIPGGAFVAVVGLSGSGKSHLAALAARLCDPSHGQVLLDSVPLTELSHDDIRAAIGYAFERPELVGRTVGDALGRSQAAALRGAAAMEAHSFVVRLPSGYQTPLAEVPMSGGERQRLGLARIWDAQRVLVLDDALSSLDTVTSARLLRRLRLDPRTRIVVTHRVAVAAQADMVVWLDSQQIRDTGPHELLWHEPGYQAVLQ